MHRLGFVLVALTGAAGGAAADDFVRPPSPDPKALAVPPVEAARARVLVRKLGSPAARDREAAQAELAAMGRLALPALVEGAGTGPSPEARARCRALLPAAEAEELRARFDAFQADADGRFEHDLPGWKPFRAVAGGDKAGRDLFAEMIRDGTSLPLLRATGRPGAELARAVADRQSELDRWAFPRRGWEEDPAPVPTAAGLATFFLADALVRPSERLPVAAPRRRGGRSVLTHPRVQSMVRTLVDEDEPWAGPFRRLLGHWMGTRTEADELWTLTRVVDSLRLREGVCVAERALTADALPPYRRAEALSVVARLGGRDSVPALTRLFDNDTVVATAQHHGRAVEVRLRDAALALCLRLTEQEPKDYGFAVRFDATDFYYSNCVFPTDAARRAAFGKWDAWEAAQKPKPAGKEK